MKKRFIVFMLLAVMSISILGFNGQAVMAGTLDVTGIESGEIYYIRNVATGKYLDVNNASDANGTEVWMYSGNRTNAQKWKVIRNSNGTYKFVTMCSTVGRVLDITGSNVDIWYDNNQYYQQFTLQRIAASDLVTGGTYYIRYGDKYISANTSNEVFPYSTYLYKNNAWSFEKVTKGDADLYSFCFIENWFMLVPNYFDTRGANTQFKNAMTAKGYNVYNFENAAANNSYNFMKFDSVWGFIGMTQLTAFGNPMGCILFKDGDKNDQGYIVASRALYNSSDTRSIVEMDTNELASARCVMYLASYTSEIIQVGAAKHGLVKNSYEMGAHFALGVNGLVDPLDAVYWMKKFYECAAQSSERTIKECLDYADYYATSVDTVYMGDVNSRL